MASASSHRRAKWPGTAASNRASDLPWQLSFSYGRALQQSTLDAWRGQPADVATAQRTFLRRARLNGMARDGSYESAMEQAAA